MQVFKRTVQLYQILSIYYLCFFNLISSTVLGAYQQLEETADNPDVERILDGWEECGCPKIVLKVESKDQLLELEKKAVDAGLNTYVVCDAGKTQVNTHFFIKREFLFCFDMCVCLFLASTLDTNYIVYGCFPS